MVYSAAYSRLATEVLQRSGVPPYCDVGIVFTEPGDVDEVSVVLGVDGKGVTSTAAWFEAVVVVEAHVSETETGVLIACVEEPHELDGGVFEYGSAAVVAGEARLILMSDRLREDECV